MLQHCCNLTNSSIVAWQCGMDCTATGSWLYVKARTSQRKCVQANAGVDPLSIWSCAGPLRRAANTAECWQILNHVEHMEAVNIKDARSDASPPEAIWIIT